MMPKPNRSRKIHWRYALLAIIRLRKTGGLVDNEVLEALKITLCPPPSSAAAASPEHIDRVRSHMSEEDEMKRRKNHHESTRSEAMSPLAEGLWNCDFLLRNYEYISDRRNDGGYWVSERHELTTPPMKRRGRQYYVQTDTRFMIHYGWGVPYRMCAITQPLHPGELRLSSVEVLTILLLAIECHQGAPDELFHTVRVFAVDSFSVRRLSSKVPSSYVRALLRSAKKGASSEPTGNITIEQTPYFDISNDQELTSVLTLLLEDEDKRPKDPYADSESEDDRKRRRNSPTSSNHSEK